MPRETHAERQARFERLKPQALAMLADGHTLREIGRRLGVHHCTIIGWRDHQTYQHPDVAPVQSSAASHPPHVGGIGDIDPLPVSPPSYPAPLDPLIPRLPPEFPDDRNVANPGAAIPVSPIEPIRWPILEDDGRGFAIITDVHIPAFDREVIERWLAEARRLGVRRFVCLGDFFQFDVLGKFMRGMQVDVDLERELRLGGDMLRAWLSGPFGGPFDEGHIIPGNHDDRFHRQMARHGAPSFWLATLTRSDDRVRWYDIGHLEVRSGGHTWHMFHGANYSRPNPGGVGVDLAERYGGNVVLGHQHMYAQSQSRCGRYMAVALPGAYDPLRLHYVEVAPRRGPAMTQGYGFLRHGQMDVRFIPRAR